MQVNNNMYAVTQYYIPNNLDLLALKRDGHVRNREMTLITWYQPCLAVPEVKVSSQNPSVSLL